MSSTNSPASPVKAYDGIIRLLECNVAYHGELKPAPYTYTFCAEWAGLDEGRARSGIKWLKDHRAILRVGTVQVGRRDAGLWLPANLV
jgi:hypothetical protein